MFIIGVLLFVVFTCPFKLFYYFLVPLPRGCLVEGKAKGKHPDRKLPCAFKAGSSTRS